MGAGVFNYLAPFRIKLKPPLELTQEEYSPTWPLTLPCFAALLPNRPRRYASVTNHSHRNYLLRACNPSNRGQQMLMRMIYKVLDHNPSFIFKHPAPSLHPQYDFSNSAPRGATGLPRHHECACLPHLCLEHLSLWETPLVLQDLIQISSPLWYTLKSQQKYLLCECPKFFSSISLIKYTILYYENSELILSTLHFTQFLSSHSPPLP